MPESLSVSSTIFRTPFLDPIAPRLQAPPCPDRSGVHGTSGCPGKNALPFQTLTLAEEGLKVLEVTQPWMRQRRDESTKPGQLVSHHCSRPVSLGSHHSSAVAKAAARNPGSTCSFSHPHFKQGHTSLTQPPWKSNPTTHPLTGERKAISLISFLVVGHDGGTPHPRDGSHSQEPSRSLEFQDLTRHQG